MPALVTMKASSGYGSSNSPVLVRKALDQATDPWWCLLACSPSMGNPFLPVTTTWGHALFPATVYGSILNENLHVGELFSWL